MVNKNVISIKSKQFSVATKVGLEVEKNGFC